MVKADKYQVNWHGGKWRILAQSNEQDDYYPVLVAGEYDGAIALCRAMNELSKENQQLAARVAQLEAQVARLLEAVPSAGVQQ